MDILELLLSHLTSVSGMYLIYFKKMIIWDRIGGRSGQLTGLIRDFLKRTVEELIVLTDSTYHQNSQPKRSFDVLKLLPY